MEADKHCLTSPKQQETVIHKPCGLRKSTVVEENPTLVRWISDAYEYLLSGHKNLVYYCKMFKSVCLFVFVFKFNCSLRLHCA